MFLRALLANICVSPLLIAKNTTALIYSVETALGVCIRAARHAIPDPMAMHSCFEGRNLAGRKVEQRNEAAHASPDAST